MLGRRKVDHTGNQCPQRSNQDATCPIGGIIVRFDGAMKSNQGSASGFVCFLGDGNILFNFDKLYDGISYVFVSELLALRDAMTWCLIQNFSVVAFCGDFQLVIRHVSSKEASHSLCGTSWKRFVFLYLLLSLCRVILLIGVLTELPM
ncbi:unnamed protein product [Linum trigynum]|uniref:RNase H type-1 domain-containing protein n=1 Tax=Linum trigynum TaxID=586398 RepID=A0AAV2CLV7_9ROSI